jgi:hypothetical protein
VRRRPLSSLRQARLPAHGRPHRRRLKLCRRLFRAPSRPSRVSATALFHLCPRRSLFASKKSASSLSITHHLTAPICTSSLLEVSVSSARIQSRSPLHHRQGSLQVVYASSSPLVPNVKVSCNLISSASPHERIPGARRSVPDVKTATFSPTLQAACTSAKHSRAPPSPPRRRPADMVNIKPSQDRE